MGAGAGLSRRGFLGMLIGGAGVLLAACAGAAPTPTPAGPAQPSAPPTPTPTAAAPVVQPTPTPTAAMAKPVAQTGKVEIDFWNPATDKLGKKIIADLVDIFNKQNQKVQVKDTTVPDENHYAKYVTAIASGTPPDAIMTYDYSPILNWAAEGFIVPLDAYQATMGIKKEDYFPVCWQMIHFHGHLWGFLQEFDFNILAWNKRLFQQAGLDPEKPPKTIAELDQMAEKLTVKDAQGNLKQIGLCPWITGNTLFWTALFGGQYFDPETEKWTITAPPNVKALEWFGKYAKMLGGADKVNSFTKLFTAEQTPFYEEAMAIEAMGEFTPITLPDEAPKIKDHYGVAFPPTDEGVPYGTSQTDGGNVFVLPKGVKNPDASMIFLTWMAGPEAVLKWNIEENNVPPLKAVAFDENFSKQVPLMKPWLVLLKLDHMVPAPLTPLAPYFLDQLANARDEVIYGRKSAKEALSDLEKKIMSQLQQFKAAHPNW